MTKERACQAKDPTTCRYHGTRIADSQWLPDHAIATQQLAELNNELMGNVGRTRFIALEEERRVAILNADASAEGFDKLTKAVATGEERLGKPDFFSEEKRRAAVVHRQALLNDTAIKDFENLEDEEYTPTVVDRLFSGTEAIVVHKGEVTLVGTRSSGPKALSGIDFDEYDLKNPLDRNKLIKRRQEVTGAMMNDARFALKDVQQDMSRLGATDDVKVNYRGSYAILSKDNVPYMRVDFQPNGTIGQGVVSGGAGYNKYIDSPIALREYIYNVQNGNRTAEPIEAYLVA